ncbi:MAG: response regulator [Flavobacterium sp.]|nr:MAG: response regulator [Flavobacterium sp.]
MSKTGPIILVEDDDHDIDIVKSVLAENNVKNEIVCFKRGEDVINYLLETVQKPFLILCDVRMQGMNGLELRNAINHNETLRKRSIPFVFFTAAVSKEIVSEAYDLTVQGFLQKPYTYGELRDTLHKTIEYWSICLHPNSF